MKSFEMFSQPPGREDSSSGKRVGLACFHCHPHHHHQHHHVQNLQVDTGPGLPMVAQQSTKPIALTALVTSVCKIKE